jgi:hypothetical protein
VGEGFSLACVTMRLSLSLLCVSVHPCTPNLRPQNLPLTYAEISPSYTRECESLPANLAVAHLPQLPQQEVHPPRPQRLPARRPRPGPPVGTGAGGAAGGRRRRSCGGPGEGHGLRRRAGGGGAAHAVGPRVRGRQRAHGRRKAREQLGMPAVLVRLPRAAGGRLEAGNVGIGRGQGPAEAEGEVGGGGDGRGERGEGAALVLAVSAVGIVGEGDGGRS